MHFIMDIISPQQEEQAQHQWIRLVVSVVEFCVVLVIMSDCLGAVVEVSLTILVTAIWTSAVSTANIKKLPWLCIVSVLFIFYVLICISSFFPYKINYMGILIFGNNALL